jgi:hypothetical protein
LIINRQSQTLELNILDASFKPKEILWLSNWR